MKLKMSTFVLEVLIYYFKPVSFLLSCDIKLKKFNAKICIQSPLVYKADQNNKP